MMMDDIERFSNTSMKKANDLMTNTETGGEFKAIIDGVNRLSILTKINDRHASKDTPPALAEDNQVQITIVRVENMIGVASPVTNI